MRIALVGRYPVDPNQVKGGPQAVFSYLVQGLERFPGLELYVVTPHKSLSSSYLIQRNGVKFHYISYPDRPILLGFPGLRQSVHRILHQIQPDLVHGQSNNILGCIALDAGYPTVLTVHSIHGSEIRFSSKWMNRVNLRMQHALMHKYFVSHARHIVSISPYIRHYYEPEVKATFYEIENPIADDFFELDSDYEIPDQILFMGYLFKRKRPDLALKAFHLAREQVPELNLHIAGKAIDQKLTNQLYDYISKNQLGDSVQFLGQLSESQVLEAFTQMSVFLLTSDLETSPMVVEQAMAAGKPVVATAVGGVSYLVDHGKTGFLVEPDDPAQLAQALVKLARDPKLRRKMGLAARREALKRFKADAVAGDMQAMYQHILNGYHS
jgi:glycosyltransferase involved in cell wall biosynthesis